MWLTYGHRCGVRSSVDDYLGKNHYQLPVLHEPYIQGSVKEINLGFLRRHLDL
jgi:hypothetical protein